jgi:excisionase family DNA binding protein
MDEKIILSTMNLDEIASRVAEKIYDLQKKDSEKRIGQTENELMNISQVAELLNLALPTIYTMTCKREIPFIKKGKKLYFKKKDVLEWLDAGRKLTREEIEKEVR